MVNSPVLQVEGLSQDFGGLRALNEVNLAIQPGKITALIGPNGAGKTTFFNCITGIYKPTEGDIYFNGKNGRVLLNGLKPDKIAALGMSRTFQNIRLFSGMSVLENVMLGRHTRTKAGILGAILRDGKTRAEEQETVDKSYALLEKVGLAEFWNEKASNLPYGAQRKLEIARALAGEPELLLLDEPAAGMNPQETADLENLVRMLRKQMDLSILLIEHDMKMVMSLSDNIYVMEYGAIIAEGKPEEIAVNPRVIKAYLGEENA